MRVEDHGGGGEGAILTGPAVSTVPSLYPGLHQTCPVPTPTHHALLPLALPCLGFPLASLLQMKVRQEKSANKRLEEALAQEREREKERVEKVLKKQEKRRREALLKEQRAAFDKEVDSRVSARVGPMRKSMAELAAEMLMGNLSDRLMLPSSRERRLMKLTKAIEGAALSEADVRQRVAETKTKQPRAPRSQSPKHPPRPGTSIGPIAAGYKFGWEPGSESQPYTPRAVDAPRPPTPRTFEPLTPRMDLAEFMPELMTRRHSPRRDVTQHI